MLSLGIWVVPLLPIFCSLLLQGKCLPYDINRNISWLWLVSFFLQILCACTCNLARAKHEAVKFFKHVTHRLADTAFPAELIGYCQAKQKVHRTRLVNPKGQANYFTHNVMRWVSACPFNRKVCKDIIYVLTRSMYSTPHAYASCYCNNSLQAY